MWCAARLSCECDLAVGELLHISLPKVIGTNYNKNRFNYRKSDNSTSWQPHTWI